MAGKYENTLCPNCGEELITRFGFSVLKNKIEKGECFRCHTPIPGRWEGVD